MAVAGKIFSKALWNRYNAGQIPVIPDIKRRSPGEGDLLQGRNPAEFAQAMTTAGAPVLSVVTEAEHFGGSLELLQRIVRNTSVPVLRKDFINHPAQLQESVDSGASAVLLIASMLEKKQLFKLIEQSLLLGLEPLVETHSEVEVRIVNELKLTLVGINNRNILELETDDGSVNTTEKLAGFLRPGTLVVSESAIAFPADVRRASAAGAHAVLVGTAILQAENPQGKYRELSEARRIHNDTR